MVSVFGAKDKDIEQEATKIPSVYDQMLKSISKGSGLDKVPVKIKNLLDEAEQMMKDIRDKSSDAIKELVDNTKTKEALNIVEKIKKGDDTALEDIFNALKKSRGLTNRISKEFLHSLDIVKHIHDERKEELTKSINKDLENFDFDKAEKDRKREERKAKKEQKEREALESGESSQEDIVEPETQGVVEAKIDDRSSEKISDAITKASAEIDNQDDSIEKAELKQERQREYAKEEERHEDIVGEFGKRVEQGEAKIKLLKGISEGIDDLNKNIKELELGEGSGLPDFGRRRGRRGKGRRNKKAKGRVNTTKGPSPKAVKPVNAPNPKAKAPMKSLAKAGIRAGGRVALTAIPVAGQIAGAGMALYDGVTGAFDDEAIKQRTGREEVTALDRIKQGGGAVTAGIANTIGTLGGWLGLNKLTEAVGLGRAFDSMSELSANDVVNAMDKAKEALPGPLKAIVDPIGTVQEFVEGKAEMKSNNLGTNDKLREQFRDIGLTPEETEIALLQKERGIEHNLKAVSSDNIVAKTNKDEGSSGNNIVTNNSNVNNYIMDTSSYRVSDDSLRTLSLGGF